MIVPMKKVSCVVMDKDRESSLEKLREAGVLHIERKTVSSDTLALLLGRQVAMRKVIGYIQRYSIKGSSGKISAEKAAGLCDRALGLIDEKKQLQDALNLLARERRTIEGWGDFEPEDLKWLASRGIKLIPYELPQKIYDSIPDDIKLIVLSAGKRGAKVLALSEIPGLNPLRLPENSLAGMEKKVQSIKSRLGGIEAEMAGLARHRHAIEVELRSLQARIEFETASAGMETLHDVPPDSAVSWLCGYVPHDRLGRLKRAAADNGWALACGDPAPGDKPPTLVRNNAVVRLVHPLFSFLGTVPGYREYDISASYLIFFCLFFSMIFGDAAYGIIILIAGAAAGFMYQRKNKTAFPDTAKLIMLLSICTIAWGSVTGAWFAMPADKLPRFLQSLVIPPFNNKGGLAAFPPFISNIFKLPQEIPVGELKTRWNIQFLCFSTGAAQLIWGRSKNIKKLFPSLTAFAQAGWLLMMLGLYFLVLFMVLKVPLPSFAVYLIFTGLGMYFVFSEQKGGNFLKNIGKSFTNFLSIFLTAVGSFADIISYIRLFAVGLAGSTIAGSFNSMALPEGGMGSFGIGFVLRVFAAVLVLVFGHALNIAMNGLSVIVHGVRLNLLEYAGNHLGMEWSGYAYKPFEEKKKN